MSYLAKAIADGHVTIDSDGTTIRYHAAERNCRISTPEEQVRAEFWAELVYSYGYDPTRIGVEVTVPDRVPYDRADLVIFKDDRRTVPFAVIECKKDGISDAEFDQAIEQAVGNGTWAKLRADFVMVVAGSTRRTLEFTERYGILERENNIVADLPKNYGKPEEFKYFKGGSIDLKEVSRDELIAALKKCHQSLWGGGRLSPPAAFGELAKLLFIKMSDESAPRLLGEPYEFQIKTHEPASRLASRIRNLYEEQRRRDPEVFNDAIRVTDEVLRSIVSHLEAVNLTATDLDVKGVAFETFMDNFFKGDYGQFFTPREVIDFCVKAMKPGRHDRVIDPACGSGGFLWHALMYVRTEADKYAPTGSAENLKLWYEFANRYLFGIEINEEIARISKMNMILHGDGHTNIVRADALQSLTRLSERNPGLKPDSFDFVLTNPPFGAQVSLSESPYLSSYDLATQSGNGRSKPRRTQKTEILYLERIWQLLKPEGKAAVVLPDGLLTNASLQYVRDFLLERFQLLGVVSLPPTTFMHFGTGVKSSILLLRKRPTSEVPDPDEAVFMGVADSIGYDAVGRKAPNDLLELLPAFEKFMKSPEVSAVL